MKHGKEGRDAIYAGLKELIKHGFIQHICYRKNGKVSHYEYIIYEQPQITSEVGMTDAAMKNTVIYEDTTCIPQSALLSDNPETVQINTEAVANQETVQIH